MTVWVTGASGMLGRCVTLRLDEGGVPWVGSDIDVDIADHRTVSDFAKKHRVQAVINCAAYTAVDAAETDESTACRVNTTGPAVLAEAANRMSARFLHVSTDYVFDGNSEGEHAESSQVGPLNAYGRTKLGGERAVAAVFKDKTGLERIPWYIVRTSWLFGAGRSSFVDTMWGLMLGKSELDVVTDQIGRPTYAQDLANFLVARIGFGNTESEQLLASGIWHFANSGHTSWHGFAVAIREEMLRLGLPVLVKDIRPVTSAHFPRPAQRPQNSVLSTRHIEAHGIVPRSWRAALAEYVELRVRQGGGA